VGLFRLTLAAKSKVVHFSPTLWASRIWLAFSSAWWCNFSPPGSSCLFVAGLEGFNLNHTSSRHGEQHHVAKTGFFIREQRQVQIGRDTDNYRGFQTTLLQTNWSYLGQVRQTWERKLALKFRAVQKKRIILIIWGPYSCLGC
jgi:hypothetical protein